MLRQVTCNENMGLLNRNKLFDFITYSKDMKIIHIHTVNVIGLNVMIFSLLKYAVWDNVRE